MIRRTWVCESESGTEGALNSNNSSVVCAQKVRACQKDNMTSFELRNTYAAIVQVMPRHLTPIRRLHSPQGVRWQLPATCQLVPKKPHTHAHTRTFVILSFVRAFN